MKRFRILLLEDVFVTSLAIGRALEFEIPECIVMRAQSLYEARVLLKTYDFHFFVVDIQLPDGCGVDFLPQIAERFPGAAVIIITAVPLPKHRERASAFGVLHFMEKPLDMSQLARLVATHLHAAADRSSTSETSFSASLQKLTALDVIQLKCLSRASVRLDFTKSEGTLGRIYLCDGEVVHAEVVPPSGAGCKEGVEAFNETLSWRGGKVDEAPGAHPPRTTIQEAWQSLILNATKWVDELPNESGFPPG